MRGFVVVVRDRTKRRGCALVESTQEAGVQDVQEKGEYFTRRGRKVCNKHRSESSKSVCSREGSLLRKWRDRQRETGVCLPRC